MTNLRWKFHPFLSIQKMGQLVKPGCPPVAVRQTAGKQVDWCETERQMCCHFMVMTQHLSLHPRGAALTMKPEAAELLWPI